MEPDMLNPKVLRELADVLLLRLGKDFYVWKKANVAFIFKRCPKNSQQVGQFRFGTWEKHRASLLEAHFWAREWELGDV